MSKHGRILYGFLTIIICMVTAVFGSSVIRAQAKDSGKTYTFRMEASISGTVGNELDGQVYTITFMNGTKLVRALPAGTNVSSWFSGEQSPLPAGMKVTVKEDAEIGDSSIKVEFTGLIWGASCDNVKISVQNIYFDANESDWYSTASVTFSGTAPKYNTTRDFSTPAGYSSVSNAIYFKDAVSGTPGWKLNGTKNTALTGGNELNVVIKGNFLVPISAGYNVTNWFTGDISVHDELLNIVEGSSLPEGVTSKIKNAI
ncbi:MAG: hypothetical protein J5824_04790, partial [Lachnospiraceae bacterium]|nr:hypothetical protein [Lachnospiraceae bacterium]